MGSANTRKTAVPELRFPEFAETWQRDSLEEHISLISGFAFKSEHFGDDGVRLITPKNFTKNGAPAFSPANTKWTTEIVPQKFHCIEGDLLVLLTDLTPTCELLGKPAVLSKDDAPCLLNQRIAKVAFSDDQVDKRFLANLFLTPAYTKRIKETATGSTVRHSSNKIVLTFTTLFPTTPEQRKIADFLTAADGRIGQLIQKKALLEDYKKGVMQQIFTQAIRFKDDHGNEFPDWEEKKLGEVCELVNGLTYSPEDVAESGLLVLRSSNVQNGQITFDDNVFVTAEVKEWNLSQPGDILICVRNGSKRLIGKNAMIPNDCPPSTHGAFMTVLRGDQNQFLFHLLQTDVYKRSVYINLGATINSINGSDLKRFNFISPSPDEQTKIANFLSAIDRKIESVATQIAKTQTFKKGLLQQMFA